MNFNIYLPKDLTMSTTLITGILISNMLKDTSNCYDKKYYII